MGIISNIDKNEIGKSLKSTHTNSLALITQLSTNISTLTTQVAAMRNNAVDYTEQDCDEVQALIDDLNSKIEAL